MILMGGEPGSEEAAGEFGAEVVAGVERSSKGTPLVSSLFRLAEERSGAGEVLAYVNTDIILMQDFIQAVGVCAGLGRGFLMVGRRWDLEVKEELDFGSAGWDQRLRERARREGRLHAASGLDYFVYRRGLWRDIPGFALGRFSWDNWLLAEAGRIGAMRIDASQTVMAIHQEHGYASTGFADALEAQKSEEAEMNRRLAGDSMDNTLDCEYCLAGCRVRRATDPAHIARRAKRFVFNSCRRMCPPKLRSFASRIGLWAQKRGMI